MEHPQKTPHIIDSLQGHYSSLQILLAALLANAPLRFVGNLINRDPESLTTLHQTIVLCEIGQTRIVLGGHNIHLLAVVMRVHRPGRHDALGNVLSTPDNDQPIAWLRHQSLAVFEGGFLMTHAGILPQWTTGDILGLAGAVEHELRSPHWKVFLVDTSDNYPNKQSNNLIGMDRLRLAINVLTCLHFCKPDGTMEFGTTDADDVPDGHVS